VQGLSLEQVKLLQPHLWNWAGHLAKVCEMTGEQTLHLPLLLRGQVAQISQEFQGVRILQLMNEKIKMQGTNIYIYTIEMSIASKNDM